MPRLTITITDRQSDLLDEKTGDNGEYESKSEAVRDFIQAYEHRRDYKREHDWELALRERENERLREAYEQQIDELERENERLRQQLAARNAREDDVGEIVEYVEQERELQRRREQRRDAPIWRRAKWYVFGRDREE